MYLSLTYHWHPSMTFSSIKNLKSKKSADTDNIPDYIYKALTEFLVKPLVHIFNLSISSMQFANALKTALVTPIYQQGNVNEISNYKAIT